MMLYYIIILYYIIVRYIISCYIILARRSEAGALRLRPPPSWSCVAFTYDILKQTGKSVYIYIYICIYIYIYIYTYTFV